MRKNFGKKTYLYPMPVLIVAAYDAEGTPNAMNAAWGGISEDHKTTANILASGAFSVSVADAEHVTECDYVGVVSGNDQPNKLAKAGLHTEKSAFVNAPVLVELPMALECRLKSYDAESCRLVGEIVNVSADVRVLDEEGRIDPARLRPITYDPVGHRYIELGATVGRAFHDGLALK